VQSPFVSGWLIFFARGAGGTLVVRLERLLKILIPQGDIDRPDKLHKLCLMGRLDGHQNFFTVSEDA